MNIFSALKTRYQKFQNNPLKRYIYLLSFIVLTVCIPLIILTLHLSTPAYSWYNPSWDNRRAITVTNSGSSQTNYDVLVTIDTSSLVSAGKMQSDCDDIRFVDSDDTTVLSFWIEGGCNTTSTQIWTRIPSLPSGSKIIYIYYGNTSATNAEQTFSGSFVVMNNTSCPSGWTQFSGLNSKFPRGASTYGGTGGSDTHNHGSVTGTSGNPSGSGTANGACGMPMATYSGHTNVKVDINSGSNLPPYLDLVYCSATGLSLSSGMVTTFDSTVPTGWTRFSTLDTKFARGNTSYGNSGGTSNQSHAFTGGYTTGNSSTQCATGADGDGNAASDHNHTSNSGTTDTTVVNPPYLDMVFGSINSNGIAPVNSVVMTTAAPPLGWTRFASLDSKFARGNTSYGGTGGTSTHTHTLTVTLSSYSLGRNPRNTIPINFSASNHNHTMTTTSASASNIPSYLDMLYYKKNDNSTDSISFSFSAEELYNLSPNIPTNITPTQNQTGLSSTPSLVISATDPESDYLRYKIVLCTDSQMSLNCSTFDQTSSQTGWSGQNTQTSTAYTSGSNATYTIQTPLTYGETYYWQSYATDPGGSTFWSQTQTSPSIFFTNAPTRSSISQSVNIYSSKREAEVPTTTVGWSNMTGTPDSGTTTSSNGWVGNTNLTAGRDYLIIASGSHNTDNTGGKSGLRVKHGSTAFENSESVDLTNQTGSSYKTPYLWFTVWTAVSGESIEMQQYWNGTGTQARVEDVILMVIDAEDLINDGYLKYSQNTTYTELTTSLQNTATLTFTPATAGDQWWIMGYTHTSLNTGGGARFENQLVLNSTVYSDNTITINGSSISPIITAGTAVSLPASSQSIYVKAREYGSDQIVQATGIFALNLEYFEHYRTSYSSSGTQLDTPGGWVNELSLNPKNNFNLANWIIAGGANIQDNGARVIGRIQENNTNITDDVGGWNNANGDYIPLNLFDYYYSLGSGFKTFDFDLQSTLSGTAPVSNIWMVAFSRETSPNYTGMILPINNDPSVDPTPILEMGAIDPDGEYIRYKVQICTNQLMTTGCTTYDQTASQTNWSLQNTQSGTAYTSGTTARYSITGALTQGQTYYWRAYSIDPAGTNTWSTTNPNPYSFTISTAPTAPTNPWVEGEFEPDSVSDITPEFSAVYNDPEDDVASKYQIQVNTASDFSGTYMWDSGVQNISTVSGVRSIDIPYAGTSLGLDGSTYYWRIRFRDEFGLTGAWSTISQFTMDTNQTSSCYLVKSPDSTSLTLKWKDNSSLEDGYLIQRKVNGGTWTTLITKPMNSISHTDSTISVNNTYQYRVTPTTSGANGGWCTTDIASVMLGSVKFGGLNLGGIQIQ